MLTTNGQNRSCLYIILYSTHIFRTIPNQNKLLPLFSFKPTTKLCSRSKMSRMLLNAHLHRKMFEYVPCGGVDSASSSTTTRHLRRIFTHIHIFLALNQTYSTQHLYVKTSQPVVWMPTFDPWCVCVCGAWYSCLNGEIWQRTSLFCRQNSDKIYNLFFETYNMIFVEIILKWGLLNYIIQSVLLKFWKDFKNIKIRSIKFKKEKYLYFI